MAVVVDPTGVAVLSSCAVAKGIPAVGKGLKLHDSPGPLANSFYGLVFIA